MEIKIKRGKDIPMEGKPSGEVRDLDAPHLVALDVSPYEKVGFKVLAKVGDSVQIGQPLLADKHHLERVWVSPAGGVVKEVRRGPKRRLLSIVIERASQEGCLRHDPIDLNAISRDDLVSKLCATGCFTLIHQRPFNLLARPNQAPRSIFVKCVESAPFAAPAEMQIAGFEKEFQAGLDALAKLGPVHLVQRKGSTAFSEAKGVEIHSIEGPHPIGNQSVHIHHIDPIHSHNDVVWTVHAHDVVSIGSIVLHGKAHTERVIGIGGGGILVEQRGYYRVRNGYPIERLVADRVDTGAQTMISGDPLQGDRVEIEDFLGSRHFAFSVIPQPKKRQFLHFFRIGFGRYSAMRAYISGHVNNKQRTYPFTTSMHGEERAFIDSAIYDRVMPIRLPTALLVKAVIADDYEHAEQMGILEVDSEDFALPTFICPCKVEMCQIIKQGLQRFAAEVLPD